jgi:NAD(P)-dependent dehydrogenase (short-subunit alcohol dehydrogenase family)
VADLSEMVQVAALAADVEARTDRLDGLVLNAATANDDRARASEGFDALFATNHLGGYHLVRLLAPLLVASAPARIVVVSSAQHRQVQRLDLDAIAAGAAVDYPTSKVLNILLVTELARRLAATGVTAYAADPGFVRTRLGRHATGRTRLLLSLTRPLQTTPAKSARTLVHLVSAGGLQNGGYYAERRLARASELCRDPTTARALWDLSARMLEDHGLTVPALPGTAG